MKMLIIELKEGGISDAPLDPPMTPLSGHLPLEVSNIDVTFNERVYLP